MPLLDLLHMGLERVCRVYYSLRSYIFLHFQCVSKQKHRPDMEGKAHILKMVLMNKLPWLRVAKFTCFM